LRFLQRARRPVTAGRITPYRNGVRMTRAVSRARLLTLALLLAAVAAPQAALAADTTAPTAPGGLTATAATGQVALRWSASSDNAGVAGYNVWRRSNPGTDWSQIAQTQSLSYTDTGVTAGSGYAYAVRAYDAAGNVSPSSAIVAATVPTTSTAPATDTGATGYRTLTRPAFTPTRVITAGTPSQFGSALAALEPGDELDVQPMTLSGSYNLNRALSSYAEIHFAPGVVFSGATSRAYYTLSIQNAANIRIYGGDVTNPVNGPCVRVADSTNVLWWHFKIHDCAATGILGTSLSSSSSGLDFDGEIYHVAYDTSFDPHAEKCTGIHGAYLGATYQNSAPAMSGKFSLYIHDVQCGGAFQGGSNLVDSDLWVKASNITYQAQSQTAGNAIQFWGGDLKNITVHDVVGSSLAGRVVETSGMYSCCDSGIVVQYGRGTNALLNPLLSGADFATNPAITYQDISPL
jgi:hypothetical protein